MSIGKHCATTPVRPASCVNYSQAVEPAWNAPRLDTVVETRPHVHELADRWRLRALFAGGGRGSNEASAEALRHNHDITCVCTCGGLVDYLSLHCAPCAPGASVGPTDGCAGPRCSHRFRPTEYAVSQTRMAVALILGERLLVLRPLERRPAEVTIVGRAATLRAAHAAMGRALAMLPVAAPRVTDAAVPLPAARCGPMTRARAAADVSPSPTVAADTPSPALATATSPPSPNLASAASPPSPTLASATPPPSPTLNAALRCRGAGAAALSRDGSFDGTSVALYGWHFGTDAQRVAELAADRERRVASAILDAVACSPVQLFAGGVFGPPVRLAPRHRLAAVPPPRHLPVVAAVSAAGVAAAAAGRTPPLPTAAASTATVAATAKPAAAVPAAAEPAAALAAAAAAVPPPQRRPRGARGGRAHPYFRPAVTHHTAQGAHTTPAQGLHTERAGRTERAEHAGERHSQL
jgi:hypothetical protein